MDDPDHEEGEGSIQGPDVLQKLAEKAAQQQRLALEELQVRSTRKVIFGSVRRDAAAIIVDNFALGSSSCLDRARHSPRQSQLIFNSES